MQKKNDKLQKDSRFWIIVISVISGVGLFCAYMAVCTKTVFNPLKAGIAMVCFYVLIVAVSITVAVILARRSKVGDALNPVLGNIMFDTISKIPSPVLICDESEERIIWYNKALLSLVPNRSALHGSMVSSIFNSTAAKIMRDESSDGAAVNSIPASGHDEDAKSFRAKGYKIKSNDHSYCIIMFTDSTELEKAYKTMSGDETIAAYIIVDNLDELLQYEQEKYRAAASQIEVILRGWAAESGGILKEYERDKYLFIFTSRNLDDFTINRFNILDRVRDIRVGEGSIPITISVGVSKISGTLAEKERAAHNALDMALQRGGDQVCLRTATGTESFGGHTKTVQKRTKVRARVITNELIMHISKSANVLVMGHKNPDFDSLGACAGIFRLCQFCGVKANIVTNVSEPAISTAVKRIARLPEYRDSITDKVSAMEMLRSDTLLIIVDVNNRDRFESPELADNVHSVVIIDHHRKTEEFPVTPLITYIEPSVSSTSELVSEMLEQALPGGMLLKEEADMLLAGILLDTKQFTRNTGTRTFSSALYLRNTGADPGDVQEMFKTNLEDFMRESKFQSKVIMYRDTMAIALCEDEGEGADRIAMAKAADKLLGIKGVEASFALISIGSTVHISARSTGRTNVQLILEQLKGGGQYESAGAQVKGSTIENALEKLKAAIDAVYYNEK